jgi:hypothetical protein
MNSNGYGVSGLGILSNGNVLFEAGTNVTQVFENRCSWGRAGPLLYICGGLVFSSSSSTGTIWFSKSSLGNLGSTVYPHLIYQSLSPYGTNTVAVTYTAVSENSTHIIITYANAITATFNNVSIAVLIGTGYNYSY